MVERTDASRDQPFDPTPRWRTLLDRALLGRSSPDDLEYDGRFDGMGAGRGTVPLTKPGADREYPDRDYPEREYPDRDYPERGRAYVDRDYPDQDYPDREYSDRSRDYPDRDYPDRDYPDRGYPEREFAERNYQENGYPVRGRPAEPEPADGYPEPEPDPANNPSDRMLQALQQELSGPRVLAFANPKGGVHKTTATILCAATVGSVRGRGVIAWDDNELRGTLGLRAGSARHARTIRHLIADLAKVEAVPEHHLMTILDDYLRHASDNSYDVLAGEENPRFAQRLDPYTVRRVLELLRRTHEVICVDTGNNVESPNWQTVLQSADQLVVTSVPREDAAFTADWMLDLLYEAGMGELVAQAVTLLSCPTPNVTPLLDDLAAHFTARTRAVVVVPYDPALESGSSIEYDMLQPATRRAWLKAAAVMMDPYARG